MYQHNECRSTAPSAGYGCQSEGERALSITFRILERLYLLGRHARPRCRLSAAQLRPAPLQLGARTSAILLLALTAGTSLLINAGVLRLNMSMGDTVSLAFLLSKWSRSGSEESGPDAAVTGRRLDDSEVNARIGIFAPFAWRTHHIAALPAQRHGSLTALTCRGSSRHLHT